MPPTSTPFNANIVLTDENQLYREGIASLIKSTSGHHVSGHAANGAELLQLLRGNVPDIVLLDVRMSGMSGAIALEHIVKSYPDVKVIMHSDYFSPLIVTHFYVKGARGYLPKGCEAAQLFKALSDVMNEGYYFNNLMPNQKLKDFLKGKISRNKIDCSMLTGAEISTIKLICQEKTNKEIAAAMGVSMHTVDYYRRQIRLKTNENSIAGIVRYAVINGLDFIS